MDTNHPKLRVIFMKQSLEAKTLAPPAHTSNF